MDDTKFIHATYSTVAFDHKPTPMEYAIRNRSLVSEVISPLDLCMLITDGKSYGNHAVRKHGEPSQFLRGNIISVDLEGSLACHINVATQNTLWQDFGLLAYTTLSHTENEPRGRLVFVTEEPLTSADDYRMVAHSVCSAWEDVDRGSWEPLRLFLGSPNCQMLWNGQFLPKDIYMQMLREARRREKEREEQRKQYENNGSSESFVEYALRMVASAKVGERNNVLNRMAFIAGKHYVRTGKLNADFIGSELLKAALACGLEEREAIRTIKSSVHRGSVS